MDEFELDDDDYFAWEEALGIENRKQDKEHA
jgi:hypothetical protein